MRAQGNTVGPDFVHLQVNHPYFRVAHLFDGSCQACAPSPGSFQHLGAHEVRADAPPPHPNPAHESGHWFHGTQFDPDDREEWDPREDDDTDPGGKLEPQYHEPSDETVPPHWNTLLGTHFTSIHHVARGFASNAGGSNFGVVGKPHQLSRIAHASLHMANPKRYGSEHDMTYEAVEHALKHGHTYGTEDEPARNAEMGHIDDVGANEVNDNLNEEWLATHPDRDRVINSFADHLRAQGHDGILYGNEHEGPQGHQCAIAFHDTPVTMHHWEWLHPDKGGKPHLPGVARRSTAADSPQAYFHGTTRRLSEVVPASQHGKGVVFPSDTDRDHAYASDNVEDAWHYAEKAWNATDKGVPRVYLVRPRGPVEKDPEVDEHGRPRSNFSGDVRTRHGFDVVRELPMPEHMGEPEEWGNPKEGVRKTAISFPTVGAYITGENTLHPYCEHHEEDARNQAFQQSLDVHRAGAVLGAECPHCKAAFPDPPQELGELGKHLITHHGWTPDILPGGRRWQWHREELQDHPDSNIHPKWSDDTVVKQLHLYDHDQMAGEGREGLHMNDEGGVHYHPDGDPHGPPIVLRERWDNTDPRRPKQAARRFASASCGCVFDGPSFTGCAHLAQLGGQQAMRHIASARKQANDEDYRMQHQAPDADYGAPLHDLEAMMPDFYAHPEYYHHGTTGEMEATSVAHRVKGRPDAKVRIYRALPAEHAHKGFQPGDWVTTSKDYALEHAKQNDDPKHDWPVIRTTVRADELHTAGDLTEYAYNGSAPKQGMVAHKGGYHQEVRQHADGVIRPVQRRQAAVEDYTYEHKTNDAGTHHYVNAYDRSGERVGDMTWHAGPPHHVTWVAVYDEENRRKGIGTGMWNKAREVDPQVRHNETEGGQTEAGAAWAQKTAAVQMVRPSQVWDHIRPDLAPHRLQTVTDSIRQHGFQPSWDHADGPIRVDLTGDTPRVGNGSHRLRALQDLGLDEPIPMHVTAMGQAGPDYDDLSFHQMTGFEYGTDPSLHHHQLLFAARPGAQGYLGHIQYEQHPHEIEIHNLSVWQAHQRRGVASQLMAELERRNPGVPIDHGNRSPNGTAWAKDYYGHEGEPRQDAANPGWTVAPRTLDGKQAAFDPRLPDGYAMRVREQDKTDRWGLPAVHVDVRHENRSVGSLSVHQRATETGLVGHPNIYVDPEHQRQGLATAMYAEVHRRWPDVPIVHSEHRSDDARLLDPALKKTFGPDLHLGRLDPRRAAADIPPFDPPKIGMFGDDRSIHHHDKHWVRGEQRFMDGTVDPDARLRHPDTPTTWRPEQWQGATRREIQPDHELHTTQEWWVPFKHREPDEDGEPGEDGSYYLHHPENYDERADDDIPKVARINGKDWIAHGHHRLMADRRLGRPSTVLYKDLDAERGRREAALDPRRAATQALYHGSMDRFEPGTVLTPDARNSEGSIHSGDWVYATTSPEAARYFASMHDGSPETDAPVHIHRVEPVGPIEPDHFLGEREEFAQGNYRAKALRVLDHQQVPGHWAREAALDLHNVRVLNPTTGHDPDLFDGEELKAEVRRDLIHRWTVFCARNRLANWHAYTSLYFTGGEASEWSGPGSNPNGDFDMQVGLDFDEFRATNRDWSLLTDAEVSAKLNELFWTELNDHDYHPAGSPRIFDLTWFSNPAVNPDIAAIRPYAAWNVLREEWAVHPSHYATAPKLPHGVRKALQGAETYARQILALPEPQRTREAAALFTSWHTDRNAAFGPGGAGVFDYANLRMKALESTGTWQELQAAANRLAPRAAAEDGYRQPVTNHRNREIGHIVGYPSGAAHAFNEHGTKLGEFGDVRDASRAVREHYKAQPPSWGGIHPETGQPFEVARPSDARYLRFGRIPANERSRNHLDNFAESGVSVYDLHHGYPVDTGNGDSLHEFLHEWHAGKRPAFVVSGEQHGEGSDTEPVLRNVKIHGEWHPPGPVNQWGEWHKTDEDLAADPGGLGRIPDEHVKPTDYVHQTRAAVPAGS